MDTNITKKTSTIKTKFIFVTGGVVSGLGKGITAASVGLILKNNGYRVDAIKFDPYLNVDPGTMSPFEHGEVFVLGDGTECDLDLGHYERFLDTNLTLISSVTAGKIYSNILDKERRGDFLGKNVQLIPHVTNYIKECFVRDCQQIDVRIIEIGGSAGDMEGEIFLEAIRQFRQEFKDKILHFHLGYVPFLGCSGEYKTKPFQNSLRELLRTGLQPDILVARYEKNSSHDISIEQLDKLALFGNVESDCVIPMPDLDSIYAVPSHFYKSNVMGRLREFVGSSNNNLDQKTKHLIFDFDGVLARNIENNLDMVIQEPYFGTTDREVYRKLMIKHFSKTFHTKKEKLSDEEYRIKLQRSLDISDLTAKHYNSIFTDFIKNISNLKNTKLAVVSSGGSVYVTKICREIETQFGIKFDAILTCEDSLYKDDKVATVAKLWNVDVRDCFYFTDTISDVVELQDFMDKKKIIGCSWGWLGYDLLATVLPANQILKNFDDVLEYNFGDFNSDKTLSKPLPQFFQNGGKILDKDVPTVKLGVVGKYGSKLGDADYSVMQSIAIAGFYANCKVEPIIIAAEDIENQDSETLSKMKDCDGFLVLGGFGNRGMEGKILAAKFARESKKPFLGICLGLQMAVVEFARDVCGLKAISAEMLDSKESIEQKDFDIIIDYIQGQENISKKGGTMRLGNYECEIVDGTLASQLFGTSKITERHRHRLEVQTKYLEILAQSGMKVSGKFNYHNGEGKQDFLPEIMELDSTIHPYFIGIQSHPEMLSRPTKAHPLFLGLIEACVIDK